ncbi:MAG TPA: hypothetical protein VE987_05050 [Polyangiaceae bacterium]|nr:hypothetical protein [Polyangiaceae bacterium]
MDRRRSERWVLGSITMFEHCTFPWRQPVGGERRFLMILPRHCRRCIEGLARLPAPFIVDRRSSALVGAPPARAPPLLCASALSNPCPSHSSCVTTFCRHR